MPQESICILRRLCFAIALSLLPHLVTCVRPSAETDENAQKATAREAALQRALAQMAEQHVDNAVLMTYYSTKGVDWQRGMHWDVSKAKTYAQHYYDSTTKLGLKCVIFYDDDELPAALGLPNDSLWNLEKIHTQPGDSKWVINDFRYIYSGRWLKEHPEIEYAFLTDLTDVKVAMNPFLHMSHGHIYSGSENEIMNNHWFLSGEFPVLGGKYLKWFNETSAGPKRRLLNAGIVGGDRKTMVNLFDEMTHVLDAPNGTGPFHNNMAAFNYVLYTKFAGKIVTGPPVHSDFTSYEEDRNDVWFIHK